MNMSYVGRYIYPVVVQTAYLSKEYIMVDIEILRINFILTL